MISAELSQNFIEPGINANKVKEKTDLALIDHLIRKPKARVSVRDLINRASDAFIAMNPCVMASPITVAQNFKKEPNIFDVVMEINDFYIILQFGRLWLSHHIVYHYFHN